MAGTRVAFEATYTSGTGSSQYRFTIYVNVADVLSVRDIRTPNGLLIDSMTTLPQSVVNDIQTAMGQVEGLLSLTSAVNGRLTFTAEGSKTVTFSTPMPDTNYRVYFTPSDFVAVRAVDLTTAGFTVQVSTTFTGTVGYDVFI